MTSIETEVVEIIDNVYGSAINDYNDTLSDLNFNNQMIDDLARQLKQFVQEKSNGAANVDITEISMKFTLQNVIDLITSKLGG